MWGNMSTKLLTILIVLMPFSLLSQEAAFTWQNPSPLGSSITDVDFYNSTTGIFVGKYGAIYKTTDGGQTFIKQNSGTTQNLKKVHYIDITTAYAVGDSGTVCKTTNGGNTWELCNTNTNNNLYGVYVRTGLMCTAVGDNGTIISTFNAGSSWTQAETNTSRRFRSVHFGDNGLGYAVGDSGAIYRTSNGIAWEEFSGIDWEEYYRYNDYLGYDNRLNNYSVFVKSPSSIYVVGGRYNAANSAEGVNLAQILRITGDTAYPISSLPLTTCALEIEFVDDIYGYILTQNRILKTNNGGINWTFANNQDQTQFHNHKFDVISGGLGYVVSYDGRIAKYDNYFQNKVNIAASDFQKTNKIEFGTDSIGYTVIDNMHINDVLLKTVDKGKTWDRIQFPYNFYFIDMQAIGADTVFILGMDELIYSFNGGTNWINQPLEELYYIECFDYNRATNELIITSSNENNLNDALFYSQDLGVNWASKNQSNESLYFPVLHYLKDGIIIGADYNGNIFRTVDNGMNWVIRGNVNTVFKKAFFIDDSTGWLSGAYGTIAKTTNAGFTWTYQSIDSNYTAKSISFSDSNNGYICAIKYEQNQNNWPDFGNTRFYKTTDGGTNWYRIEIGFDKIALDIHTADSNLVYIVGDEGGLMRVEFVDPLLAPTLLSPSDNNNTSINPYFRFNSVPNANSYTVEVATDLDFTNIVSQPISSDTLIRVYGLLEQQQYFWRVKAYYSNLESPYSEIRRFVTNIVGDTLHIGEGEYLARFPYHTEYKDANTTLLYTADELYNSGFAAGYITHLGFNIQTARPTATMNALEIKMQNTGLEAINEYIATDWTTVRNSAPYICMNTGVQLIQLNTPFYWDGSSNLLINYCFDNNTYSQSSYMYGESLPGKALCLYADLAGSGCNEISSMSQYPNPRRPNLYFMTQESLNSPNLLTPANNAVNQSINPIFNWDVVTNATSYRIQISTNQSFNYYTANTLVNTNQFTASNLSYLATYYWRVQALNDSLESRWSQVRTFTTITPVPLVPTLSAPSNSATLIPISTNLGWNAATYATSYRVQVSNSSNFAVMILNTTTDSLTKYINGLSNNTTYFWRIQGINSTGNGEWSETFSFTTIPSYDLPTTVNITALLNGLWNGNSHTPAPISVEVRTGSSISASVLYQRKTAMINTNGVAELVFDNLATGDYWIVVRAAGYIPLVSNSRIAFTNGNTLSFDFSRNISNLYSSTLVITSNGRYLMKPGDFDSNRRVNSLDLNLVKTNMGQSFNFIPAP